MMACLVRTAVENIKTATASALMVGVVRIGQASTDWVDWVGSGSAYADSMRLLQ